MSEDNPDALPPASYLGDFARAYPNAKLLYRADDPFQNTGPGEVWDREWVSSGRFFMAGFKPHAIVQ